jgi:hypothetical protein
VRTSSSPAAEDGSWAYVATPEAQIPCGTTLPQPALLSDLGEVRAPPGVDPVLDQLGTEPASRVLVGTVPVWATIVTEARGAGERQALPWLPRVADDPANIGSQPTRRSAYAIRREP